MTWIALESLEMSSINIKFNWVTAVAILFTTMMFTKETYDDHVREITSVFVTLDAEIEGNRDLSEFATDKNPFSDFLMFIVKAKLSEVATYNDYGLFSTVSSTESKGVASIGVLGNVFVLLDEDNYRAFRQQ